MMLITDHTTRRPTGRTAYRKPQGRRPGLEALEGRQLLTVSFTQTNLVSDVPGMAATTDPNLVNPWGIAFGPNRGIWVANNGTGTATVYDGNGKPIPQASPLVVNIPAPGGGPAAPTGQVSNATPGFVVSAGGKSGPSNFLFSTDNPFTNVTAPDVSRLAQANGETLTTDQPNQAVANTHKIFSYGRRNGFGLAFDPITGSLWESENGDSAVPGNRPIPMHVRAG